MSAIKEFYMNIADKCADAIYSECFDVMDYQDCTYSDVQDETMKMVFGQQADQERLFGYLYDHISECDGRAEELMPETFTACCLLYAFLSDSWKALNGLSNDEEHIVEREEEVSLNFIRKMKIQKCN